MSDCATPVRSSLLMASAVENAFGAAAGPEEPASSDFGEKGCDCAGMFEQVGSHSVAWHSSNAELKVAPWGKLHLAERGGQLVT